MRQWGSDRASLAVKRLPCADPLATSSFSWNHLPWLLLTNIAQGNQYYLNKQENSDRW